MNRYTSEFLPTGGTLWQAGPDIPSPGLSHACAVAIDSTRFVLIGGKVFDPKDSVPNVRVYDSASSIWSRFGKMILLLHKTTCQLLGTIELHCVSKTLTHHRGSQNNFRLFNGSCFRICMTCNRRKFDRLTMKTDLFQKQAPKMACFGCNESGFPDFGRSCRSNWWHQVKYRGTLKSFGCNACNELCERHQK